MGITVSRGGKRVKPSPPYGRIALRITAVVLALILVLLYLFSYVFMVVRYYGDGMEPTLTHRQTVVVLKTDRIRSGDVVAFYYNNKILVRRVVAGPGTSLDIDGAGVVRVDERVLDEPYVSDPSRGQCNIQLPCRVPQGQYFVMGDNRAVSMDSRLSEMGTIDAERIIGKVIWTL